MQAPLALPACLSFSPLSTFSTLPNAIKLSTNPYTSYRLLTAHPVEECGCVRLGKCKWFNVAKGWGFLTPNDGGQEVFVHQVGSTRTHTHTQI